MSTNTDSSNAPAPVSKGRGFLHEVIVELRKTTWPTPKEAWRLTVVVLAVLLVVGVYVGTLDLILSMATRKFGLIK